MRLAKPRVDIGLNTNNLEPMLAFWQNEVGLAFDHILPIRKGMQQHRHDALGSVVKINHYAEALPETPPSGYAELLIARQGLSAVRSLQDPDGNKVTLVPPGSFGVTQIGVRIKVRALALHRRFYAEALGLTEETVPIGAAFRAGETAAAAGGIATGALGRRHGRKGLALHHVSSLQGRRGPCARACARRT